MEFASAVEHIIELMPEDCSERRTLESLLENVKLEPDVAQHGRQLLVSGLLAFAGGGENPPAWAVEARVSWNTWLNEHGAAMPPQTAPSFVLFGGSKVATREALFRMLENTGMTVDRRVIDDQHHFASCMPAVEELPKDPVKFLELFDAWHEQLADLLARVTQTRVDMHEKIVSGRKDMAN